jgi:hypothetical protein
MTAVQTDELRRAVESQRGGRATFVQAVPVHESRNGQTVWNGAVHVFDLADNPGGATRAYAWSYSLPGGQRRMSAILHTGPVTSPREAVRAAIVGQKSRP